MTCESPNTEHIRFAMLGMVEGNGHPYSWSAIVNGYNPDRMADCPYPVIAEYLSEQPLGEVSIADASVTHIWAKNREDAEAVAETTHIETVIDEPTDAIGEVDAIIIPTDDGDNHAARVAPLIESGLPIFVDKPLTTDVDDLGQFVEWHNSGVPLASSSAIRYAPAVEDMMVHAESAGELRWVTNCTHKTWERYGIHALEPVARLLGPGFECVSCTTDGGMEVYTISHKSGVTVTIAVEYDLRGSFCSLSVYGTKGSHSMKYSDTYTAFRRQLLSVVEFARTGTPDIEFTETVDLMACLIAGKWSRERDRRVDVSLVYESLPTEQP